MYIIMLVYAELIVVQVPHARSGADQLNVLQYFLVDVITFMLSVLFLTLTLIYYMLKLMFRFICFVCCRTSKQKKAAVEAKAKMIAKKTN